MVILRKTLLLVGALAIGAKAVVTQDCYYYSGQNATDQQVCDGSSTCCGQNAICESYRLCKNPHDPEGVFVRGPCAVKGWGSSDCPSLCQYDETSGIFPRVMQCDDQSWCCSNKTGNAVANDIKSCCSKKQGVFIDALGNVVSSSTSISAPSSLPSATTTTASGTKPASTSATTTPTGPKSPTSPTPKPPQTPTSLPSASGGLSTGAKAGLGAGLGVGGAALIGLAALYYVMKMRKSRAEASKQHESSALTGPPSDHEYTAYKPYHDMQQYSEQPKMAPVAPVEAIGTVPGQSHNDAGRYEMEAQLPPQELEGSGLPASKPDQRN